MNWLASILICCFISTIVMTLFSGLVSQVVHQNYIEPYLLNKVFGAQFSNPMTRHSLMGWIVHFAFGCLFVISYHVLWYFKLVGHSWVSGLILGFISGLIGILGWRMLRRLTPDINELWQKNYYGQLLVAHILFGIIAAKIYSVIIE
jgi:hypothetical protein